VLAYAVLGSMPFVLAATAPSFWEHEHATAPAAAAAFGALLLALVLRRRWAWFALVVFQGAVLVSYAFDFTSVPSLLLNALSFALLTSKPMRRFLKPTGRRDSTDDLVVPRADS
jgi:hypothetical protein